MAAARTATCPREEQIADFSHGKLDPAAAETIASHLETCVNCRIAAESVAADSFIARLRAAHGQDPSVAPPPDSHVDSVSRMSSATLGFQNSSPPDPCSKSDKSSVPPELVDHPDYELVTELGRGGMGVVYLARNRVMDRLEVLKVVNTSLLEQPGARERFQREVRAAAKLSHLNIVAAYSVPRAGNLLIFAMEYVAGQDLSQLVKQRGPLPVTSAAYYAHQAALGLQHAHEQGMVHRDIKPNNLILSVQGERHLVKILDFGLAKATSEKVSDADLTGSGQMLGTPDYVAPEQTLDAQKADIRADIYSLGCTLYYMLAGKPPFQGTSLYALLAAHHSDTPRSLSVIRPEVPAELAAVVAKMMAKQPGARYQTPAEVAQALGPFFRARGPITSESSIARAAFARITSDSSPELSGGHMKRIRRNGGRRRISSLVTMAAVVLFGVLVLSGVLFQLRTADGVLTIEVNEPNPDIVIDGQKATVRWDAGGKQAEISLPPGMRKIEVTKDGFKAVGEEVTIEQNGRQVLVAKLEPLEAAKVREKFVKPKAPPNSAIEIGRFEIDCGIVWALAVGDEAIYYGGETLGSIDLSTKQQMKFPWPGESHVTCLDVSPDDRYLVSGSGTGAVQLWNTRSHDWVRTLGSLKPWHTEVRFSGDGRTILASGQKGECQIWDINGNPRVRWQQGQEWCESAFQGNDRVVTVDTTMNLTKRMSGTGTEIWRKEISKPPREPAPKATWDVTILTDKQHIFVGHWDGDVSVMDPNGKPEFVLHAHSQSVMSLAVTEDGRYLLTGGDDGFTRLWDVNSRQQVWQRQHGITTSARIVGNLAFCGCNGGKVIVLDLDGVRATQRSKRLAELLSTNSAEPQSKPDKTSDLHEPPIINSPTPDVVDPSPKFGAPVEIATFDTDAGVAWAIEVGETAVYYGGGTFGSIELGTGEQLKFPWPGDTLTSLSVSPDHRYLASGSLHGSVDLWDTRTHSLVRQIGDRKPKHVEVHFSHDGRTLLATVGSECHIWDLNGRPRVEWQQGDHWCDAGFQDENTIVTADSTFGLTKRLAGTGREILSTKIPKPSSKPDTASPRYQALLVDKQRIILGHRNGDVTVLDNDGRLKFLLDAHPAVVMALAVTEDGRYLITSGQDGPIRFWDLKSRQPIWERPTNAVSLRIIGNLAFCGCAGGTIRILQLEGVSPTERSKQLSRLLTTPSENPQPWPEKPAESPEPAIEAPLPDSSLKTKESRTGTNASVNTVQQ